MSGAVDDDDYEEVEVTDDDEDTRSQLTETAQAATAGTVASADTVTGAPERRLQSDMASPSGALGQQPGVLAPNDSVAKQHSIAEPQNQPGTSGTASAAAPLSEEGQNSASDTHPSLEFEHIDQAVRSFMGNVSSAFTASGGNAAAASGLSSLTDTLGNLGASWFGQSAASTTDRAAQARSQASVITLQ